MADLWNEYLNAYVVWYAAKWGIAPSYKHIILVREDFLNLPEDEQLYAKNLITRYYV